MTVKHIQIKLTQSQSDYIDMTKIHHGLKSKKEALAYIVDEMMSRAQFTLNMKDTDVAESEPF